MKATALLLTCLSGLGIVSIAEGTYYLQIYPSRALRNKKDIFSCNINSYQVLARYDGARLGRVDPGHMRQWYL